VALCVLPTFFINSKIKGILDKQERKPARAYKLLLKLRYAYNSIEEHLEKRDFS